jgi:protein dpy-30
MADAPQFDEAEMAEAGAAAGAAAEKKEKASAVDVNSLPIRAYLDQTVVPLLLQGMSALVKER